MMNQVAFSTASSYDAHEEYCPAPGDKVDHYTQIVVSETCCIPEAKPDSTRLIGKVHHIQLCKVECIQSVELVHGQPKKGKKIVVSGQFEMGIEYIANGPDQKVHYFACSVPFTAIILNCCGGNLHLFSRCFSLRHYAVHACLEHLQVKRMSPRSFDYTAVLMLWMQRNRRVREPVPRRRRRWTFTGW